MNKVVNNLLESIHQARDDWESESARAQLGQTSSVADTQLLIAAIGTGPYSLGSRGRRLRRRAVESVSL